MNHYETEISDSFLFFLLSFCAYVCVRLNVCGGPLIPLPHSIHCRGRHLNPLPFSPPYPSYVYPRTSRFNLIYRSTDTGIYSKFNATGEVKEKVYNIIITYRLCKSKEKSEEIVSKRTI